MYMYMSACGMETDILHHGPGRCQANTLWERRVEMGVLLTALAFVLWRSILTVYDTGLDVVEVFFGCGDLGWDTSVNTSRILCKT